MKWCQTCQREFQGTSLFCPIDGQPLTTAVILDDKYRLEAKIGSGGMGEVYRATHIHIDTVFAVKVLHSDLVSDPSALARFRQEAKATAQIRHLNAVAVTDFGVSKETGMVYLVMEFLEGENLRERLNRLPLTYQEVFWLLSQACEGIHAAHQKGIIHRDIKPDNIFITQDSDGIEIVKVVDFGIAKLKRQVEVNTLTGNNLVIGTPYYMSPEQAQVQPLDARSDIYSLGVMTYEMLTGQVPFSDSSWISVVLKHVNDPVPPLRSLNPKIPEQLEQVVLKALAKKAEHRQQTARELALEFRNALRRHGLISDSLSGKTSLLFSNSAPSQRGESPRTGSTKAVSTDQRPEANVPSNAIPRYQTGAVSALPDTGATSKTPGQVQFPPNAGSGSRLSPDIPEINQPIKSPDGYHTRKSPRPGELPKRDVVFPEAGPVLPINDTGPRYVTHQTPNQPGPADFHNNPTVSDLPESAVSGTPSLYLNDDYGLDPRPINQAATISDINQINEFHHAPTKSDLDEPGWIGQPNISNFANQSTVFDHPAGHYETRTLDESSRLVLPPADQTALSTTDPLHFRPVSASSKLDQSEKPAPLQPVLLSQRAWQPDVEDFREGETVQLFGNSPSPGFQSRPTPVLPVDIPSSSLHLVQAQLPGQGTTFSPPNREVFSLPESGGHVWFSLILGVLLPLAGGVVWWVWSHPNAPDQTHHFVETTQGYAGMKRLNGGILQMGNNLSSNLFEKPEHLITVPSFYLDEHEVTNEEYFQFCQFANVPESDRFKLLPLQGWIDGKYMPGTARHPVVNVTWDQAQSYAAWMKKRLPTEAEWEFAARGSAGRLYPWGNSLIPGNANAGGINTQPFPVASYPSGATPEGIVDLIGNVAEWVASDFHLYPGSSARQPEKNLRSYRGGSFADPWGKLQATTRFSAPHNYFSPRLGFRCAKDVPVR